MDSGQLLLQEITGIEHEVDSCNDVQMSDPTTSVHAKFENLNRLVSLCTSVYSEFIASIDSSSSLATDVEVTDVNLLFRFCSIYIFVRDLADNGPNSGHVN
eukprot:GHVH01005033.1.p2 GENE.GHVH01005033.1~~GHVH01005033.1.p2  ORF type:complete len:101 (+),score=13.81 GHVH01005033.1:50-352(+)